MRPSARERAGVRVWGLGLGMRNAESASSVHRSRSPSGVEVALLHKAKLAQYVATLQPQAIGQAAGR